MLKNIEDQNREIVTMRIWLLFPSVAAVERKSLEIYDIDLHSSAAHWGVKSVWKRLSIRLLSGKMKEKQLIKKRLDS